MLQKRIELSCNFGQSQTSFRQCFNFQVLYSPIHKQRFNESIGLHFDRCNSYQDLTFTNMEFLLLYFKGGFRVHPL